MYGSMVCALTLLAGVGLAAPQGMAGSHNVIGKDSLLTTPVGGLEATGATANVAPAKGPGFGKELRVVTRRTAPETNATQLTIPITQSVAAGDVMLADFWIRGAATTAKAPAAIIFLFEKSTEPWTKSVTAAAEAGTVPSHWRHIAVPFRAVAAFRPGEAMVSLRFATQVQTVEIGGLTVSDLGTTTTLEQLVQTTTAMNPLGSVDVRFDFSQRRQTMIGMGGDFCQPRYGSTEPMDVVGQYCLDHLLVAHARIGLPLNYWTPQRDFYVDDAQARASFLALQMMKKRGIPCVVSIWEAPEWLLGGSPEQSGRALAPDMYGACTEAIARYLITARDKYGVTVPYLSFNEPDYGVNFKFTPKTMADFIRQAGPRFAALGLPTKFLVGDTGGGSSLHDYAEPVLADASVAQYLGPISFHCWDGLTASQASYEAIAQLGRAYHKPIWCLEAGHDSALWRAPGNPWGTWENALQTARVYERTIRLTHASLMDYWTYQDNYPIVDKLTRRPYPVFQVIKQMQAVFAPGAQIVTPMSTEQNLSVIGSVQPSSGAVAVLLVNSAGPGAATLRGLPRAARFRILVSDGSGQSRALSPARSTSTGTLRVTMPTRSVVTVVEA